MKYIIDILICITYIHNCKLSHAALRVEAPLARAWRRRAERKMERVSWELSVLSKAVAFSNLSNAAGPVGLSQPQLSRIVSRLEGELKVVLLDRAAKRKSGWTPIAHQIGEIYGKSSRHLGEQIRRLTADESDPLTLHIGALDGLYAVAAELSAQVFKGTTVRSIELDLFDLIQLEASFLKGDSTSSSRGANRVGKNSGTCSGWASSRSDEAGRAGDDTRDEPVRVRPLPASHR